MDASKLRLTSNRLIGKQDDEIDSTDGEDEAERSENNSNESSCSISASLEDLKGEFDTESAPLNEELDGFCQELLNSQPSGCQNEAHVSETLPQDSSLSSDQKPSKKSELESVKKNDKQREEETNAEICILTEGNSGNESHKRQDGSLISMSKHATVEDVAEAFSADIRADDIDKVERLQV